MKLIYIANARIPTEKAHGIQIMKMCESFARNNCEVELVVPRRINKIKDNPFEYYGVEKNFKITKLPCLDLIPFGLGNFGFWVQTISFLIFARIYLLFKKYDILYTREQFTGLFFKNFVLEIHSLPKKIKSVHKKIWGKARVLVVLTSFIKNKLVEAGVPENKILIAPDGVDIEKFQIPNSKFKVREKLNLPQDKKIVAYTGSFYLYDWKGLDILLEAAKFFDNNYLLLLVGGRKEEIDEIKKRYKLENIILVEHQPHSQIPYYLKSADVLVLPNKKGEKFSEEYTSPLKLFEYMTSGVPIVASDLPSIREILNENNAVLVEPNNPEKLAEGIKKILENYDFSDKISKQALQDVQNYTWQKRAERIIRLIKVAE